MQRSPTGGEEIEIMNFKIIDPLTGAGSGAIIAGAVYLALPEGWNMIQGMIAGGAVGMGCAFFLMILLMPFFGSFEVMIPVGIIGMLVGMTVGMTLALNPAPAFCLIALGGLMGLTVAIIIYFSNKKHLRASSQTS